MDDASLESIPAYNRVSIRAVLVPAGVDPGPALQAAGIFDPIAIPVVVGEDASVPGGILGDGVASNLRAVLETEHHPDADGPPGSQSGLGSSSVSSKPAQPVTTTASAAFGFRSFAPIRQSVRHGRFDAQQPNSTGDIDSAVTPSRKKDSDVVAFELPTNDKGRTTDRTVDPTGKAAPNQDAILPPWDASRVSDSIIASAVPALPVNGSADASSVVGGAASNPTVVGKHIDNTDRGKTAPQNGPRKTI